jgi:hypothetical protein
MKANTRVLLCRCEYAPIISPDVKRRAASALVESGLACDSVPDLCELAARQDLLLGDLAGASRLLVAACHARAVEWLFAAGGAPLQIERVEFFDLRDGGIEGLLQATRAASNGVPGAVAERPTVAFPDWRPWFPVIDYSRCQGMPAVSRILSLRRLRRRSRRTHRGAESREP